MKADSSEQAFQGVLLADIGGTNARFAILADGMVREIVRMAVSDYRSFPAVLSAYLGKLPAAGLIRSAIFCSSRRDTKRPLRAHQQSLGDRCRRVARCLRIFHGASTK